MAKTLVPTYVAQALAADRTQQVNTLAALTVYLFGEAKANREVDDFGAYLFKASPHKSLKTWQNYATTVRAIAETQTVKLESLWSAAKDPSEAVAPLVSWLTHELKTRKYQTSMEDVANWAKGRPSMAAKKAADDKAEKEALAAQAKANADAEKNKATQAQADAEAAAAAALAERQAAEALAAAAAAPAPAPVPNGDEQGTQATGYAPAIGAPSADTAPVFMASFARAADGSIVMTLADGLTRDDLVSLALALEMQIEPVEAAAAAPAPFPVLETA